MKEINLKIGKNANLLIKIDEPLITDYKECERMSEVVGGDGKDCSTCSLELDGWGLSLCEIDSIVHEIEKEENEI